jgi:hypothetical protein
MNIMRLFGSGVYQGIFLIFYTLLITELSAFINYEKEMMIRASLVSKHVVYCDEICTFNEEAFASGRKDSSGR